MPELAILIRHAEPVLMVHPSLSSIELSEREMRVRGVGYVLLQLLEIQDQLGEPLNLNGDMLKDLIDGSVRPVPAEGVDALVAMLAQAGLRKRGAREKWTEEQFEKIGRKFYADHSIFDPDIRPPTFERIRPSNNEPSLAQPVEEPLRSKRERKNAGTELQKARKRAKISLDTEQSGAELRNHNTSGRGKRGGNKRAGATSQRRSTRLN
ncbi:hypothetical protein GGX14DRAFT_570368 [Mycena pura]|nr:hypothetical protein GGX14DRAFT_570368 [Mycena pura]